MGRQINQLLFFGIFFFQNSLISFASSYDKFLNFKLTFNEDMVLPCNYTPTVSRNGQSLQGAEPSPRELTSLLIYDGSINQMTSLLGQEDDEIKLFHSNALIKDQSSVMLLMRVRCGFNKKVGFASHTFEPSPVFRIKKGEEVVFRKKEFKVAKSLKRVKKPGLLWTSEDSVERLSSFAYPFDTIAEDIGTSPMSDVIKELQVLGASKNDFDLSALGLNSEEMTFDSALKSQIERAFGRVGNDSDSKARSSVNKVTVTLFTSEE